MTRILNYAFAGAVLFFGSTVLLTARMQAGIKADVKQIIADKLARIEADLDLRRLIHKEN